MYKENGDLFVGKFEQGVADGPGVYIFQDGSYYDGKLVSNVAECDKGHFKSKTLQYNGGFKDNMFHGHGSEKGLEHEFKGTYEKGEKKKGNS